MNDLTYATLMGENPADVFPAPKGCEWVHDVGGPHEGCREFAEDPVFYCDEARHRLFLISDSPDCPGGGTETAWFCYRHGQEVAAGGLGGYAGDTIREVKLHVSYPHEAGYLHDCPGCYDRCHCSPGHATCVWPGHDS